MRSISRRNAYSHRPGIRIHNFPECLFTWPGIRSDTTASEQLVRRFADHFWKTDWPGSSHPGVFYDPRALDPEGPGGVLHAKAVVADDEAVFITSANLTEAALDRNIELGVLIRDRAFALAVGGYFRNLIDRALLKPLPLA